MFSHKELDGKNQKERVDMINKKASLLNLKKYEDYDDMYKMGTFVMKNVNNFDKFIRLDIKENRKIFDDLFIV